MYICSEDGAGMGSLTEEILQILPAYIVGKLFED